MQHYAPLDDREGDNPRASSPEPTTTSAFALAARQAIVNTRSDDDNPAQDSVFTASELKGKLWNGGTTRWSSSTFFGRGSSETLVVEQGGAQKIKQQMAISVIERYYMRHARTSPDHLFLDAGRTTQAEWGTLRFPGSQADASQRKCAAYLRISSSSTGMRVARLIAKYWKIRRPSVLISITGGATSLKLSQRLEQAFTRGLQAVAQSTNAVIFTGGTSAGVMALVGSVFAHSTEPIPLIGFLSWTKLHGRQFLEGNSGEVEPRAYVAGERNNANGAGLESRHTHFVLADGGEGSGWGAEISLRDSVQQTYATLYNVPSVLLVVQGGPGTLQTINEAIHSKTPVVLLAGSGGAADAVVPLPRYPLTTSSLPPHYLLTTSSLPPHYPLTTSSLPPHHFLTTSSLPPHYLLTTRSLPPHHFLTTSSLPAHYLLTTPSPLPHHSHRST